jgi:hypothetical protein
MRRLIVVCCATAMLLFADISNAAMTGNKLKELADQSEKFSNLVSEAFLTGFVSGIADANFSLLCFPEGVTYGQEVEVVKKYLKEHPEELHLEGNVLVMKAIRTAWPCKK